MRNDQEYLIVDMTFNFSLMTIDCCEKSENEKKYVLAHQLLKSGTSINSKIISSLKSPSSNL